MIIPIRTSIQPRKTPYANYAIIGLNVVVFLMQFTVYPNGVLAYRPWVHQFMLTPRISPWYTFVTYAFLHHDFWHIFFNMFFLYLFGRNVNDKLGHTAFIAFYICGAVASGFGQALLHADPLPGMGGQPAATLGASGAVAAVTGAYLVLFPQTLLTVVYWLIFIGKIEVPALYFIALKLILIDNMLAQSQDNIAYNAHLAGYAFGILITIGLLATQLVDGNQFDLWAMIRRWNRRRVYRDSVSDDYDPYTGRRSVAANEVEKTVTEMQNEGEIRELRTEITQRLEERNLPAAADLYIRLMKVDRQQVLPRQHLLDIANQLAGNNRPSQAAWAYEQLLTHYGQFEHAEQVELMLGILYSRYLDKPAEAIEHLKRAVDRLSDPGQVRMCRDELAKLEV